MTPKRYMSGKLELEAVRLNPENIREVAEWAGGWILWQSLTLIIPTPSKNMRVDIGDYVIRAKTGMFYPCPAHYFHQTYEEVRV